MTTTSRAAYLAVVLARAAPHASPHHVAQAVEAMQRAARAHKADATLSCNVSRTDAEERKAEKRLTTLELKANMALEPLKPLARVLELRFGGDPRGHCAWLLVEGLDGDGFGPGFGIYE